jgi:hypothetical protein
MSAPQPLSAILKRIREMPVRPKPRPGERCELCAALIPDEHGHVVDLESRALMCACRPCYLVFEPQGAGGGRFRAVPDRYMSFPQFSLSSAQWDALQIPVGVAFFFMNSSMDQIAAFYPSPAGATESLLPLDSWQDHRGQSRPGHVLTDVEAFLVRTTDRHSVGASAGATSCRSTSALSSSALRMLLEIRRRHRAHAALGTLRGSATRRPWR